MNMRRQPSHGAALLFIALTLLIGLSQAPAAKTPAPRGHDLFPGAKVATVRFFSVNLDDPRGRPSCPEPVGPDGKLCKSVVTPGVTLTAAQAAQALQIVRARNTFNKEFTNCFLPHHALIFFDTDDRPVGFISICFMCHQATAFPALSTAKLSDGYYALSSAGMEHLRVLCHEAGLPYCDAKTPGDFPSETRKK